MKTDPDAAMKIGLRKSSSCGSNTRLAPHARAKRHDRHHRRASRATSRPGQVNRVRSRSMTPYRRRRHSASPNTAIGNHKAHAGRARGTSSPHDKVPPQQKRSRRRSHPVQRVDRRAFGAAQPVMNGRLGRREGEASRIGRSRTVDSSRLIIARSATEWPRMRLTADHVDRDPSGPLRELLPGAARPHVTWLRSRPVRRTGESAPSLPPARCCRPSAFNARPRESPPARFHPTHRVATPAQSRIHENLSAHPSHMPRIAYWPASYQCIKMTTQPLRFGAYVSRNLDPTTELAQAP